MMRLGLSGLRCAKRLADSGIQVTIFEKSRGLGGRIATRRSEVKTITNNTFGLFNLLFSLFYNYRMLNSIMVRSIGLHAIRSLRTTFKKVFQFCLYFFCIF